MNALPESSLLTEKFAKLGVESAPGQEGRQQVDSIDLRGDRIVGTPVDFSHGDVDAHPPIPGSLELFQRGYEVGGSQAYTEYRGQAAIREQLAAKLAEFTGAPIDSDSEMILTPGTQGALFLAMGANIGRGDKVAIVEPDYFANRKLVEFFEGELVPVGMDYFGTDSGSGIDLLKLGECFRYGVKLFVFSNPNNPTGVVYSPDEILAIAELAETHGVRVIVDQLYSRQIFDGVRYTHLRGLDKLNSDNLLTIIGPSKTESLSGFRLGAAFGSSQMIDRMEKLQAIVSLRAAGYCQTVLANWFSEPTGWIQARIAAHQAIRDDIHEAFLRANGFKLRLGEGGSYLFPQMPEMDISIGDFVKVLRLQAEVIVTPGTQFGPQFTNSFRINFSQDHTAAVQAIQRTIEIANRYRV
ncbi:pyridoxal phosphate-dependent aminotransferase [Neorhodopirellula pilleata]|uniref:Aspartate aminotransferase n=1 Tax=Neorhodopirellula pilleata TaxID=2714738 RepID=A0A5C6ATM9_9BACT|nr:pyridoxal phosphate-dependent aminotransferase [Neorhodopirellula pilleata]TWU03393.1 Aspartate aminotransferase [Neorhodopirellula pilleata]